VGRQNAEVLHPQLPRPPHGHSVGRSRGLEAYRKEHDILLRDPSGQLQCIEGRVDNPYLPPFRPYLQEVRLAPRYPEHVSEGGEDHVGAGSQMDGPVDLFQRGNADRATRTMDHLHRTTQDLVDPLPDDGVRLPAADLHQHPSPRGSGGDAPEEGPGQLRIPVLAQVPHG